MTQGLCFIEHKFKLFKHRIFYSVDVRLLVSDDEFGSNSSSSVLERSLASATLFHSTIVSS